jgi:Zn finger protein HypA/HybF involved in hydrogenase expression
MLVRASLACTACLADVEWEVRGVAEEAEAHCSCPACGAQRDLILSPEQALRLRIGGGLESDGWPLPPDVWPL